MNPFRVEDKSNNSYKYVGITAHEARKQLDYEINEHHKKLEKERQAFDVVSFWTQVVDPQISKAILERENDIIISGLTKIQIGRVSSHAKFLGYSVTGFSCSIEISW